MKSAFSVSSVKIRDSDDYKVHLLKEVAIMEKRQYAWQPESKGWQTVVDGIRKLLTKVRLRQHPHPRVSKTDN
jgi:hypothetical protein